MLSSYCKLSFILFLILNAIALVYAYSPTTETNPLKYDTQFSISLNSFTSESVFEQGAITRYSDAYGKATTFFRNQYGLDISGNGTRLPPGCELFTGSTSDYVVNYARVRGFPILAGSQDVGVHDDTISIRINQPTVLNGAFGKNGALVESNSILYFGFYTFFWRNNGSSVFPRIIYSGMLPLRFDSNSSMLNFQLTSTLFGQGYARGSTMIRKDQSGRVYTSIIISQTFQISISDFSPKCSVITSETDIFNENFVIKWNNVLLSIIRDLKVVPPVAARQLAILHLAIDKSLVECKNLTERNCTHPTMVSLISHAASRVLKTLYSSQLDCINAALKSSLECNDCKGLSMGYLERIGKPGIVAADKVLNSRESDGCNDFVNYEFNDGSMYYQSHAPNFNRIPLLPHWSLVKPFVIQNISLFDQGPPPSINSPLFERDYNETFQYGKEDSQVRTLEQTKIALFWADGAGTSTPPGHWLNILKTIIRNRNVTDTLQISSLFKVLTVTMADAAIVCWHHKYKYNAFRPITAFTESERVSNWSPLIATPPFPEYSSGHSTISAAAARILSLLFESNEISFESTSEGLIHTIRKFNNLFDAAKEAGKSRIYGGIHFDYANQAGLVSGANIANAIHNTLLQIKVQ